MERERDKGQDRTAIRTAGPEAIAEAGSLLRAGQLVAFPTETVYGLGADARNERAVSAIFAAKERPRFNPLIVHVTGRAEADDYVHFNALAERLAAAFWPGGLTLVLPRREPSPLSLLASAGLPTAALRAPSHPVARALLHAAAMPIAAPSANRSGRISPTTAQAVEEELDGRVSLILDGGPCTVGLESAVVGFEDGQPVLLRPGAIPAEDIEAVAGPLRRADGAEGILAPGMMASHYAPRARLRLNARTVTEREALLAFGPDAPEGAYLTFNLSPAGDLQEAAANLFAMLRALDASGAECIAAMPVPERGLGVAINDRLRRAALR